MGKAIPKSRWQRAKTKRKRSQWWFPLTVAAMSVAAFSAVFFAPSMSADIPKAQAATLVGQFAEAEEAHFPICSGARRITCVVDGDTIWYQGEKIRLADVSTPEITNPGCAREARLGGKATRRLQHLLNDGAFTLEPNTGGDDVDRYGRSLLIVTRGGESLGDVLVAEGLAERWGGHRIDWC